MAACSSHVTVSLEFNVGGSAIRTRSTAAVWLAQDTIARGPRGARACAKAAPYGDHGCEAISSLLVTRARVDGASAAPLVWQAALSMWIYTVVCFAFLGLKEVAVAMSDPFGDDDVDFDVERLLYGEQKPARARVGTVRLAGRGGRPESGRGEGVGGARQGEGPTLPPRPAPLLEGPAVEKHNHLQRSQRAPPPPAAAWTNALALLKDERWPDGQTLAPGLRNPVTDLDATYVERVKDLPPGWDSILNPKSRLSRRSSAGLSRCSLSGVGSSKGSGPWGRGSVKSDSIASLISDKELLAEYDSKVGVGAFRPRRSLAPEADMYDADAPVAASLTGRRLSIDTVLQSGGSLSWEEAFGDLGDEELELPGRSSGAAGRCGAPGGAKPINESFLSKLGQGVTQGFGALAPSSAPVTIGSEEKPQVDGFLTKIGQGLGEGIKPIAKFGNLARGFSNFGRSASLPALAGGCTDTRQAPDAAVSLLPLHPLPRSPPLRPHDCVRPLSSVFVAGCPPSGSTKARIGLP